MKVAYYRPRKNGPENDIEDTVALRSRGIFGIRGNRFWTAASLPIGSGMPDLTIVTYEPIVFAIANLTIADTQVLGYLRAVRSASATTIAAKTGRPVAKVINLLDILSDAKIVIPTGNGYIIDTRWRNILPHVITVEAKINKWQLAIEQAVRNRIFSHESYVAFPEPLANRVFKDPLFKRCGIGVLAVDGDDACILKPARRSKPMVWAYYYQLALELVKDNLRA